MAFKRFNDRDTPTLKEKQSQSWQKKDREPIHRKRDKNQIYQRRKSCPSLRNSDDFPFFPK